MAQIGLQGTLTCETRNYKRYQLLQNPFSKHPIKLLPKDILSNLPVADNVGSVVHELAEFNERLRALVSKDIGRIWLETAKSAQKEMLLGELKTNKPFFIETVIGHLKHCYQVWHTRHRSVINALTHLVAALAVV